MNLENQLRLNNYLLDTKSNQIFEVQFSDLLAMQNGEIDYYKPVEITEERLIKLGFTKTTESRYPKFHLSYIITIGTVNWWFGNIHGNFIANIEFIHELQNLYFSLKGVDLVFSTEP